MLLIIFNEMVHHFECVFADVKEVPRSESNVAIIQKVQESDVLKTFRKTICPYKYSF